MATAAVLPRNPFDPGTGTTPQELGVIAKAAPSLGAQQKIGVTNAPAAPDVRAAQANAARIAVDPATQTVQGQLKTILAEGSPLLDQAQTRAAQGAQQRGLLNSSMAVTAGQSALYDAATPIAQADAGIYGSAATNNANFQQQTSLANQASSNTVNLQNASSRQQAAQFNAQSANQASTRTAELQASRDQASADNKLKLMLQQMDANTRTDLVNLEANYKTTMQASQSASDLYKQTIQMITNITQDTKLNATAKNAAIAQQKELLANGMNLIGAMNDIGVGDLLNFRDARRSGVSTNPVLNAGVDKDTAGEAEAARQRTVPRQGPDFG